jgi:hypothetical protein
MKAVVPANFLCSNEPREFCDLQTICFRYDEERECRSSLTIFMREVIKGALPRAGFRKTSDFIQKKQARRLA